MEQSSIDEVVNKLRDDITNGVPDYDFYQYEELHHVSFPHHMLRAELNNFIKLGMDHPGRGWYSLNSQGFRSDEFTTEHDGKHILFAGCSHTFGQGVPLEDLWAKKVYDAISQNEKTSGFFNVSFIGATYIQIVMQLFRYFKKYGDPDVIFVNLPDAYREFSLALRYQFLKGGANEITVSDSGWQEHLNTDYINIISIMQFKYLEQYCKDHNIKLYLFSTTANPNEDKRDWGRIYEIDPRNHIPGFLPFTNSECYEHVFRYQKSHKDSTFKDFLLRAVDDEHFGAAFHDFWYNFIYNRYLKDTLGEKNG